MTKDKLEEFLNDPVAETDDHDYFEIDDWITKAKMIIRAQAEALEFYKDSTNFFQIQNGLERGEDSMEKTIYYALGTKAQTAINNVNKILESI